MASISKRANGTYVVRFMANGSQQAIGVGKSERQAERMQRSIEDIQTANKLGRPFDPETAAWLAKLPDDLKCQLGRHGLIEVEIREPSKTLGELLESYFAKRTDVKPATKIMWGHTKRNLLAHFTPEKALPDINQADAEDFERYLKTEVDSLATARRRIGMAKQFLQHAVKRGWISTNPFAELNSAVGGNVERQFFVTRDMTDRVLKACPDLEWKLLVVLARYGGVRTPSESLTLKWKDIDWKSNKMTVHSPKTEHHDGKEARIVPLFPEIREYLLAAKKQATGEYVIERWRDAAVKHDGAWKNCNLRTHFIRIILRAGLEPWPKVWQNMRSSRQTELEDQFPGHVVCSWMGNSQQVARRHYLQILDEHFLKAIGGADTKSDTSHAPQTPASDDMAIKKAAENCGLLHPLARGMGVTGFEHTQKQGEKQQFSSADTNSDTNCKLLLEIASRWPALTLASKRKVLAIVRRAS